MNHILDRMDEVYLNFLLSYTKFFKALIYLEMTILSTYIVLFTFFREFLRSGAYDWALTQPFLGFTMYTLVAVAALVLMVIWSLTNSKTALIIGIGLFTWIQLMFGISILVLTFSGSSAALIGTIQWLSIPIVNIMLLMTSGIPPHGNEILSSNAQLKSE